MAYTITAADLETITDNDVDFGTTRFLPSVDDIPRTFYESNPYTQIVSAMAADIELPDVDVTLKPDVDPEWLRRCVMAHLRSFEPRHEDKIAGVAYLISLLTVMGSNDTADAG